MCASVEAFIVPGCLALALRGLWPNAPKPAAPPDDAEAGGGGGGGEAAPLLLAGAGASFVGSSGEAYSAAARRAPAPRRVAWARAVAAGDVGLAGLAVLLGAGLVANGVLQQFL
jgi:hypothetical protein